MGYQQANVVVLPASFADDFEAYCRRNGRACPVLERSNPGSPFVKIAQDADIRTDVPRYRLFEDGVVKQEPRDVRFHWRDDSVAFLLGCSFSFERALAGARIPLRHLEAGRVLPMYITDIDCTPSGSFAGPLVVSVRPVPEPLVATAADLTGRLAWSHGAPVHIGDGTAIGIVDLGRPDFGDPPVLVPGDIPVFWACGVTPQRALAAARPPYAITHYPAHMFITDLPVEADGPVNGERGSSSATPEETDIGL
jgi:uncharacterized protein YcsI (UPF0317 family)